MNPWEQDWEVEDTSTSKPWEQDWETDTPWTQYGAPANPQTENAFQRFGRGVNIGLTEAGMGLKGIISDLTPEDKAKLEAGRAYMSSAGLAPKVGQFVSDVLKYAPAGGFAGAVPRVLASTGLSALFAPEDRGQAAITGGIGSLTGEGLGAGLSKLIRGPVAQPGVQEFVAAGGKPSFAQAIGQPFKRLEETASSFPLIGTSIDQQQARAIESFNKMGLQSVVDDLRRGGVNTTLNVEPGSHGFNELSKVVSDAYGDLASRYKGQMTAGFQNTIDDVRQLAKEIPTREEHINRIIDDQILPFFEHGGLVDGDKVKLLDTKLGRIAREYSKKGGDEFYVGEAAAKLRDGLHTMIGDVNPDARDSLQAINSAYGKFKTMEKAMTRSVGNEMATPASTLQALRSRNPTSFARGNMPMQRMASNANELIGNRYPDSGTAGRLQVKDLLVGGAMGLPAGVGAYYAGKGLYSPAIQDWLVNQSLQPAGLKRLFAMDAARRAGAPAGAATTDYLRQ